MCQTCQDISPESAPLAPFLWSRPHSGLLGGRCRQGVSPHHQGLEVGWLRHMEGGSKLVDAQGLVRPADSPQQGEKEAHCAPRLALPLHTHAVLLREPRSCLTYSDSPELSESAGGRIRCVHVVLPLPGRVGPLARPLGSGARALRENHPDRFAPRPGS